MAMVPHIFFCPKSFDFEKRYVICKHLRAVLRCHHSSVLACELATSPLHYQHVSYYVVCVKNERNCLFWKSVCTS